MRAIESRVSYRQFLMIVSALFALLGTAYAYHDAKRWHEEGGVLVVKAARDAEHNRKSVEDLRDGQQRIESKVDDIRGWVRGNHAPTNGGGGL